MAEEEKVLTVSLSLYLSGDHPALDMGEDWALVKTVQMPDGLLHAGLEIWDLVPKCNQYEAHLVVERVHYECDTRKIIADVKLDSVGNSDLQSFLSVGGWEKDEGK